MKIRDTVNKKNCKIAARILPSVWSSTDMMEVLQVGNVRLLVLCTYVGEEYHEMYDDWDSKIEQLS